VAQRREGCDASLPVFPADPKGLASRESSGQVLNVLARNVPWLMGGAADLAPSTKTRLTFDGAGDFEAGSYHGRNFHFGIREHAMCAMANGMSLVKVRPFASTFLIFTDYARGAIRLSALMEIPVIYIWTHDSFSVGEDGPTHQPIEQLASLRAMPGIGHPARRRRGDRGLAGHPPTVRATGAGAFPPAAFTAGPDFLLPGIGPRPAAATC
jgi:transketolase